MSYVEANLGTGEQVVYKARIHWAAFIQPVFLLVLGFVLWSISGRVGVILFIVLAIFAGLSVLSVLSRELAVTTKRVIGKTGFIKRESLELRHDRVEAIKVDQGIFGRLLGYGQITVVGTGSSKLGIGAIAAPLLFRHQVDARNEIEKQDERPRDTTGLVG